MQDQKPSEGAVRVVEKLRESPHVVVFDIEEVTKIIDRDLLPTKSEGEDEN